MKNFQKISNCRVCDSTDMELVLALGDQPLANSLKTSAEAEEDLYPLTLIICKTCSLVQLEETVAKEALFRKYVWVTGTSSTARDFAEDFCKKTIEVAGASPGNDYILEVASNDGTFLKPFKHRGFQVLGVDPARNICELAEQNGVPSLAEFWGMSSAKQVKEKYGSAKVIFARNVIPHVSELNDVIQGIKYALALDGTGAIEFHYGKKIQQELQYDSIYHEHLCYFSIKTISNLLARHGLYGFEIEASPISGGALILYFAHEQKQQTAQYLRFVEEEKAIDLNSLESWRTFGDRCRAHRELSLEMIAKYKNKKVVAFGASARSSTYLNFCGFTNREIFAVIDNSPQKQNLFTAGSSIPIIKMEAGLAAAPELIFLLAWNFTTEVLGLLKKEGYRGPVMIPFPGEPYITTI